MKSLGNIILLSCVLALVSCSGGMKVSSPDGKNALSLQLDDKGTLYYNVNCGGNVVVENSQIGLLTDNPSFCFKDGLKYVGKTSTTINEEYTLPAGKKHTYINKANVTTYTFENAMNQKVDVVCHAANDGVAFKCEYHNETPLTVQRELTEVRLPKNTTSWMMDWTWNYETFYPERAVDSLNNGEYLMPALTRVNDVWNLITEAEVYDKPAMHLMRDSVNGKFDYVFAREDTTFVCHAPFKTSWKVFMLGDRLGNIVESTLVENLNPPTHLTDTEWITPGVAVFPWWGNYLANSYIDTLKTYVDLAHEMKWEWLEFDVSLINTPLRSSREWENVDWIPELTAYAKEKGIKVYGWDEIAILDNKKGRDFVFDRYKEMGIDGIKIDYIDSDSKYAMEFRDTACAVAAEKHLMVSFHGETLPRGHRRFYPNMLTNEAVRGAEYYTFKGDRCANSTHNCTLPFTRNVVGPMDYTPCTFTIREENPRTTTYAHELALPFIFESGWVCMADRPEAYLTSPAKPLLQKVEAAWDEIHFIDGYPGKYVCLARRKGAQWFIACINGPEQRKVSIDLGFLPKGKYNATVYCDGDDAMHTCKVAQTKVVESSQTLEFDIIANGGLVIDITKTK